MWGPPGSACSFIPPFPEKMDQGNKRPGLRQGLTGGRGGRWRHLLARCFRGLYLASWYSSKCVNLSVIAARRQAGRDTSLSPSPPARLCQRERKPSGMRQKQALQNKTRLFTELNQNRDQVLSPNSIITVSVLLGLSVDFYESRFLHCK